VTKHAVRPSSWRWQCFHQFFLRSEYTFLYSLLHSMQIK